MDTAIIVALIGSGALVIVNIFQAFESRRREVRQTNAEQARRDADAQHEQARMEALHEHDRSERQVEAGRRVREIWSTKRYEVLLDFLKNAHTLTRKLKDTQWRSYQPLPTIPPLPAPPDEATDASAEEYRAELARYKSTLDGVGEQLRQVAAAQEKDIEALQDVRDHLDMQSAGLVEHEIFASEELQTLADNWLKYLLVAFSYRKGSLNQQQFDKVMHMVAEVEKNYLACLRSELGTAEPLQRQLEEARNGLDPVGG